MYNYEIDEKIPIPKDIKKEIYKRRAKPNNNTFKKKAKWGLPENYIYHTLTKPGLTDDEMYFAMILENDERDIMNEFWDKQVIDYNIFYEGGVKCMGVLFEDKEGNIDNVYGLTPTALVFLSSHLSNELLTSIIYDPSEQNYFIDFMHEYYETQTTDIYKKIISKEQWDEAIALSIENMYEINRKRIEQNQKDLDR